MFEHLIIKVMRIILIKAISANHPALELPHFASSSSSWASRLAWLYARLRDKPSCKPDILLIFWEDFTDHHSSFWDNSLSGEFV